MNCRNCPHVTVHQRQAGICSILPTTFNSTHSIPVPTQLFVHCSVMAKLIVDSGGGGALVHVLIVSFGKWSVAFYESANGFCSIYVCMVVY